MKSKNIFLSVIFALFLLSACTEEKIIDGPDISGKGNVTLELAPSSIIAKADGNGYTYATEDELVVSSCWIYVVDHQSKKIVTRKYFAGTNLVSSTGPYEGQYTKGYQVEIKGLNFGNYDFWVIANPTDGSEDGMYGRFREGSNFSDLKEAVIEGESSYGAAFGDPTKLIKQGCKEEVSIGKNFDGKVKIAMTQLAARVELRLTMDFEWELKGEYYEYPNHAIDGNPLSRTEAFKLVDKAINGDGEGKGFDIPNGAYSYLSYPVTIAGNVKGYKVSELDVNRVSKYKGYTFRNLNLHIENIRSKAFVMVPAKETDLEGKIFTDYEKKIEYSQKEYSFIFYTYSRDAKVNNPLRVSLSGQIGNAEFEVVQKGVNVAGGYFIGDKDGTYVKSIQEGVIPEGMTFSDNGWGSTQYLIYVTNDQSKIDFVPSDEGKVTNESEVSWKEYETDFKIEAPDNITNGNIENGNLYRVGANVKYVPTTGNLDVEIEQFKVLDLKFEFN